MAFKGIANLVVLTGFVAGLGNAAGTAFEDGKIGVGDYKSVFGLISDLSALTTVDFKQVTPEAKDLDAEESAQIYDAFAAKLDLPASQDAKEGAIEAVVASVLGVFSAVKQSLDAVEQLKAAFSAKALV